MSNDRIDGQSERNPVPDNGTGRSRLLARINRAVFTVLLLAIATLLAVLSQRQMSLVYDLDNTTLTIRAAEAAGGGATNDLASADDPAADLSESAWESDGYGATDAGAAPDEGAYAGAVAIVDEEVVYELQGIVFTFIEVEGEDGYRAESGVHTITYYSNGRCTPHTIGFSDDDAATAVIEVDALASAQVVR